MPVIAAQTPLIKNFNQPLDFNKKIKGHRIFGPHKTWRGLIVGAIFSSLTLWLQQYLYLHFSWCKSISGPINYSLIPLLIVGPLFGIGALMGDAIESFLKRQRGIGPGSRWFPFDQTDYIIGGALTTFIFFNLNISQYILIFFVWLIIHVLASYVGYLLGLKDQAI